jgi:hypothetical protein
MAKPYRRRYGVIRRSTLIPAPTLFNDGGEDAPLSKRGRAVFRGVVLLIIAAGLVLLAMSR